MSIKVEVMDAPKILRISEVIERLQSIKDKEGDLKVVVGMWNSDYADIFYEPAFDVVVKAREDDWIDQVDWDEKYVSIE